MKIIQIMGMPNDECWQGHVLGLGDDGVTYISCHVDQKHCWEIYIPLKFKEVSNSREENTMKTDYKMDYNNPKKSGQIAYLRGHDLDDNPCDLRTSANAHTLWGQGWEKQSKIECKGVALPDGYTGCTQTDGDCPVCGL